jgi:hypothetical protein
MYKLNLIVSETNFNMKLVLLNTVKYVCSVI